jgi:1-deoxy-D-xylulose-5-phosphate reductoisomerase
MQKKIKNIAIFGSTGSIGVNSINVIKKFPDKFKIKCLTTNKNIDLLIEQTNEVKPECIIINDEKNCQGLETKIKKDVKILYGRDSFKTFLQNSNIDILINALVGFSGLEPTVTAIKNKIDVALANKESLVTGGELIKKLINDFKVNLIPIDSEHSAILQCLIGEKSEDIARLILTASGGPFLNREIDDFKNITLQEALNHPNWKMGKKITIDSATLMNKGLEVIEASWLFNIPQNKIDVVIHPQSIIHSMVEFIDGSIKAQMGIPNMRIPIQYALTYPNRLENKNDRLDLLKLQELNFFEPDLKKFPCLKIAYKALEEGGTAPTIMNAANEVAVELFLNSKIKFTEIYEIIEKTLNTLPAKKIKNIDSIIEADRFTREKIYKQYS